MMTYLELSKLPVGTVVIDTSDDELGVITAGRFFHIVQWDNGERTTFCTDGKKGNIETPYRPVRQA